MLEELVTSLDKINTQTQANFSTLGIILLILWGVYVLNLLLGSRLLYFGIYPRHILGLIGIIFAPFLHGNFSHLFFNSIPLVVLANFILFSGLNYFLIVTALIMLISGFLVWCFGKPGLHIGASAVITGYWSFLVLQSFKHTTITTVILGIICVYYFAGIFLGIFPSKKGISWEGHLFGLIAGFVCAYFDSNFALMQIIKP